MSPVGCSTLYRPSSGAATTVCRRLLQTRGRGDRHGREDANGCMDAVRDEATGVDRSTRCRGGNKNHFRNRGALHIAKVHHRSCDKADLLDALFPLLVRFQFLARFETGHAEIGCKYDDAGHAVVDQRGADAVNFINLSACWQESSAKRAGSVLEQEGGRRVAAGYASSSSDNAAIFSFLVLDIIRVEREDGAAILQVGQGRDWFAVQPDIQYRDLRHPLVGGAELRPPPPSPLGSSGVWQV